MSDLTPQYVMVNGVPTPVQGNSLSNPTITIDTIRQYIINGQVFSVTTGIVTAGGTAGVNPMSLFNPSNSGKTLYVIGLKSTSASTGQPQTNVTTTDPAYATPLTPINNKLGSGATSIASCTSSNTLSALTGTAYDVGGVAVNGVYELVSEYQRMIIIPPGNGLSHGVFAAAAAKYGITAIWIEA